MQNLEASGEPYLTLVSLPSISGEVIDATGFAEALLVEC